MDAIKTDRVLVEENASLLVIDGFDSDFEVDSDRLRLDWTRATELYIALGKALDVNQEKLFLVWSGLGGDSDFQVLAGALRDEATAEMAVKRLENYTEAHFTEEDLYSFALAKFATSANVIHRVIVDAETWHGRVDNSEFGDLEEVLRTEGTPEVTFWEKGWLSSRSHFIVYCYAENDESACRLAVTLARQEHKKEQSVAQASAAGEVVG